MADTELSLKDWQMIKFCLGFHGQQESSLYKRVEKIVNEYAGES